MFLLAYWDEKPAGCVAYRKMEEFKGFCELKRLYVKPEYRGKSIGQCLMDTILSMASKHY